MTTTKAKSKKAAPNICPEISNKISTRGALSVVEATRQNILEAFLLPNEISIALSSTSSKMGLDQPLAVLPNVVSFGRLLLVLETKQSPPVGSSVLKNWADQMETESSSSLVSGATSGGAWETITSRQRFAGSVRLATLKFAKSLVVSESGSPSAAVVLHDMPLGVSAADIKTAFGVFGMVTRVVLKPTGIWQYVVVHFKKLDSVMSALNHWLVLIGKDSVRVLPLVNQNKTILSRDGFKAKLVNLLLGCTAFEISDMISQISGKTCFISQSPDSGHCLHFALVTFGSQADLDFVVAKTETGHLAVDCKVASSLFPKTPKVFKPYFVDFLSYAKAFAPSVMSEFSLLIASTPSVTVVNPAVGSRLDFLEKQISDLAALVKSIVEPVGSLVVLVSCLLDDNAVKAVQIEKDLLSMKYASNNFANLMVDVSKDIACLRSEVDFGGMDYDDMQAVKSSLLSEDTIECVIALWRMLGAEIRSSVESTRLFLSGFIFDSKNLNSVIKKIRGLGLFPPLIVSV
ncbi:hypothetical protein G9A89_009345 [Geosiphon pyriformis]|nr:hypothetical protein G9A89_009345 [Geosiphon pyriformis]